MLATLSLRTPKYHTCISIGVFVAMLLPLTGCATKTEAAPPPPPEVQVVSVQQKDVPIYGEWVATLDGYINADIRPQVTGYLMKQNYREGMLVRKGEVMFEIDPRPFQAELEEAQGQQAQAEAQRGKTASDRCQSTFSSIRRSRSANSASSASSRPR